MFVGVKEEGRDEVVFESWVFVGKKGVMSVLSQREAGAAWRWIERGAKGCGERWAGDGTYRGWLTLGRGTRDSREWGGNILVPKEGRMPDIAANGAANNNCK